MFSLIILNYIEALGFGFPVDTVCNEGHGLNLENTVEALDPQPAIMVNKYIIKKCKTTTYQKSFLIRTSRIWGNCLADEVDLSSSTLASFESVIFNYFKSALAVSCVCEDPRSSNSVQVYLLKCNIIVLVHCLVQ